MRDHASQQCRFVVIGERPSLPVILVDHTASYSINWKERLLYSFFYEHLRLQVPKRLSNNNGRHYFIARFKAHDKCFSEGFDWHNWTLPPFFEENERSQEQPEGVPSSPANQEPSIQEPPSVQGSPTEASFQQYIMDDFIIQSTPIQKEKCKSEPKETPETEPSHHFTTEQDLSGVPFDIYATPESYINQTHPTSLLDESTKLNEMQRPWVPQPGTARSFQAQDQFRELLEEQRSENR